jgi:hypothetical protein
MGHRGNMLIAEGGRLDVHYSHWGAQSVLADALRGPDPFIRMIQECTKDDSLIQDAAFGEAIAFVDRDRHELMDEILRLRQKRLASHPSNASPAR